jgi:cytochrome c-type biogenesis protein CcmH/NrfG
VAGAAAALRAREFDKALVVLQPELRKSPGNPQTRVPQDLAYSGAGKRKEALPSFQNALQVSPEYLPALEGATQIEYEIGGREAANPTLLEHVLRLAPADSTADAMVASVAFRKRNCSEAILHYEQSGPPVDSEPVALRQYGNLSCENQTLRLGRGNNARAGCSGGAGRA